MSAKWKTVAALALLLSGPAFAADEPGISATEIKIGGVFPFSGPASSIGLVGKELWPISSRSTTAVASMDADQLPRI